MVDKPKVNQRLQKREVDKAISHYSKLFALPKYKTAILALFIQCMATSTVMWPFFMFSSYGVLMALAVGTLLFLASRIGDRLTASLVLKKDLILDLRRCSVLSLASNVLLTIFVFAATVLFIHSGDMDAWFKMVSIGVFASLSLRFLVFCSISFVDTARILLSAILQPASFLTPLLAAPLLTHKPQGYFFIYIAAASLLALVSVQLFTTSLNSLGKRTFGIPSIKMFRAFLSNWTEGRVEPIEEILEILSEEHDITVTLIGFGSRKKLKTIIVVPTIHPGPFKNVGSSNISGMLQKALEEKFGCVVAVSHGISGHELDLASQNENRKVISRLLESSEFNVFHSQVTPLIVSTVDGATACCQIFGDSALFTLTLAPDTMEDLPLELNNIIAEEAQRRGLTWAAVIDAHNSIEGEFDPTRILDPVKKATISVLEKAMKTSKGRLMVGAAKINPADITFEEGLGPAGIVAVVTKVKNRTAAYVFIDGNNMVSGLREKILESLNELGIDRGEILTTDTHVVNAIVVTERGYHPLGEIINHQKLIKHIKDAVKQALENLEPVEVSWSRTTIRNVKVIGDHQINRLSVLVNEVVERAKRASVIVFPVIGGVLAVLLMLI